MAALTLEDVMKRKPMPLGSTNPQVFLCLSCSSNLVVKDDPVCGTCKGKLTATPYRMPWAGIAVMVGGILASFVTLAWFATG